MATFSLHHNIDKLPSYHELPKQPGLPVGCIWGFWDRAGQKDEFGSLTLLTPTVIIQAATRSARGHIRFSEVCNLWSNTAFGPADLLETSWPLNKPNIPVFQCQRFHHNIINNRTRGSPYSLDDEISFNTQSGSQWDGLRHVIQREAGLCYNGVSEDELTTNGRLGIDSEWLQVFIV